LRPPLTIQAWTNGEVRISWPTNFTGFTLQYSYSLTPPVWANVNQPVITADGQFVVFDTVGPVPKYYRLVQ
jgi:hypothetical protein